MHIRKTPLSAVVVKGEFFVIETEQVQNSGVVVVDRDGLVARKVAHFIGSAVAETRLQSRARHPNCEDMLVMISPLAVHALRDGGATEFRGPENEGVVEQAAGLQVLQ